MDSLVAKYSRPAHQRHESFEDETEELTNPMANLSLKFAMPPVAQVRTIPRHPSSKAGARRWTRP
jgi:hypothetical protein